MAQERESHDWMIAPTKCRFNHSLVQIRIISSLRSLTFSQNMEGQRTRQLMSHSVFGLFQESLDNRPNSSIQHNIQLKIRKENWKSEEWE